MKVGFVGLGIMGKPMSINVQKAGHTVYAFDFHIENANDLVELGVASDPAPTTFSHEELLKFFPSLEFAYVWGTNCRIKASRARALGWKPKYTIEDMMKSVKPEIETFLRK